jgi:uracil-DNA glycosylase
MGTIDPVIETSWKDRLAFEFQSDYFRRLKEFLLEEKKSQVIYPPGNRIFAAFDLTPFYSVKVVILGQDPYHGRGQAHGLCFSVPDGIDIPPSLHNIFKELQEDLGIQPPGKGNLEQWARQGVLLLNATLTVRAGLAGSHQHKGWENFTDAAIRALSDHREHLVFLLWGNYARAKAGMIDPEKHLILQAAHPSPFSADRGFFGCRHFSRANQYLILHGIEPVNWHVS